MKRYRFRLDPVLRVRRVEQDAAQAGMAAAQRDLTEAEEALVRSVARYQQVAAPPPAQAATAWLASRGRVGLVAATVVAAGTGRETAAMQAADRRAALQEARQRVSALERLDERRREEHALAARRDEDAQIDDLVTGRHGRVA